MPYPSVRQVSDSELAEQGLFNAPLQDLTQRTDYLLSLIQNITQGNALRVTGVNIDASATPGTPVYLDTADGVFKPALGALDASSDYSVAAESSLWRGVVGSIVGTVGDVVTGGSLTLLEAEWEAVIDTASLTPGRYFLSEESPGKITTTTGALGIYIGDLTAGGTMYMAGQGISNFLNHIHATVTLVGDPAGTISADPGVSDPHVIDLPDAAEQGWLPANATYFPGFVEGAQIPTGAKFGYNIQHPNEARLRSLFPPVPIESAQFSLYGQILDDTQIIANQYGLWWMTDTYGDVPWAADYSVSGDAYNVEYWTVRVPSSTSFVDIVYQNMLLQLIDDFDTLGVSNLTPGPYLTVDRNKGPVTITNDGVHLVRGGAGTTVTGTAGTAAAGLRGQLRIESSIERQMALQGTGWGEASVTTVGNGVINSTVVTHNLDDAQPAVTVFDATNGRYITTWSVVYDSSDQLTVTYDAPIPNTENWVVRVTSAPRAVFGPLTTNGVMAGSGTSLGLKGAILTSTAPLAYLLHLGEDLPSGVAYRPTIRLVAAVDTPEAAPTNVTVVVKVYGVPLGNSMDSNGLLGTYSRVLQTGLPDVLQTVVVSEAITVARSRTLYATIEIGGATPATSGTVRVVGAYTSLARNA